MDGDRFDDLSRLLASGVSRRSAVKGIAGGLLGALGLRGSTGAQVTQADCGNQFCASNPGNCNPGCVCCVYTNSITGQVINSRCRPPGTCSPGTEVGVTTTTSTTQAPSTTTTTIAPTTTSTTTTTAGPTTTTAAPCVPKTCRGEGKECGTISDACGRNINCGACGLNKRCENNVCYCANGNTPCLKDCTCMNPVDRVDDICSYTFAGEGRLCTHDTDCPAGDVCGTIISSRPAECYRKLQVC